MKKLLTLLLCTFTTVALSFGFTACGQPEDDSAVNLVAIESTQIGVMSNVDYYVVPEPAATTKVNAVDGLEFAGDLQQLYGGEAGYPQAVVVAKKQLATSSDFVSRFIGELKDNSEWILDESTSAESIVTAVRNHLTEGMSPTFTANNLSKQVISNCGINFVSASDGKTEIINFMEKINAVSETSFGTPSDAFFWDGAYDATVYSGSVSVYAPDGAPALSLAKLLASEQSFYDGVTVNYEIVDSSLIQTFVAGANPSADICVLPVNLAVKLLGSGENYVLAGTITHGNLYMVSNNGVEITAENLDTLKGKTVGVVNLAAVPGLTFKIILKNNGIDYVEIV